MAQRTPLDPLEIVHRANISLGDVACELGLSRDWTRRLARDPQHRRRVLVAALKVTLQQEQLALTLESLTNPRRRR